MLKTLIINIVKALSSLYLVLLLIAAFIIWAVYIKSIGFGNEIFTGLFISSLVPVIEHKGLTKAERAKFVLTPQLKEILVGLILGDLFVQKQERAINARLFFEQGTINKDYLFHLFELFISYCSTEPRLYTRAPDKRTGNIYSRLTFKTLSLPCFNELYSLFYVNGVKIVPLNIGDLLTVHSLAYWLCDDGTFCKSRHKVRLCTESFTLAEVNLLIQTLNTKWDLKCTKVARGNGYRIVIPTKSLPVMQSLLKDIMPSPMLHKIGL